MWNSRSIVNKLRCFQSFIYAHDYSFIVLTETWLHDYIYNNELIPSGYTIYRKDRNSKGGGVLVAVKSIFKSIQLTSPDNLEVVAVTVHAHHSFTICAVYIPPNSTRDYIQDFYLYLNTFIPSTNVILLGDFNAPDVNWDIFTSTNTNSECLCDFVIDNNMFQHVNKPTHIHGNILDLVISSDPELITDLVVHPHTTYLLQSDHHIITFSICAAVSHYKCRKVSQVAYDFNKADWFNLNRYIALKNGDAHFYSTNIETAWARLKDLLTQAMEIYIPKKRHQLCHRPQWFTSEIQHHLNKLHTLRKKVKRNPSDYNKLNLKVAESTLQQLLASARQSYESALIDQFTKTNSNNIYKYISSLTSSRSIPATMTLDVNILNDDSSIANSFNEYFYSVFTQSSVNQPVTFDSPTDIPLISSISILPEEVYHCLSSLDAKKAAGIDGLCPRVLKQCAGSITPLVYHLFDLCISSHSLPGEWQIHLIVPVYKSGSKTDIKNYRPISLLCILSKILEKLIHDKIIDSVTKLISPLQFGFMRGRSSLQQLLMYINTLIEAHESFTPIDVVYLDIRKAFDSVPHNELLTKLWSMGIRGSLWKWLNAYLTDRKQCVRVNKSISEVLPVLSGVPQGSILGPLLFILYINDFPSQLKAMLPFIFADDTKCLHVAKTNADFTTIQEDLNVACNWSKECCLSFNCSKSAVLHFWCHHENPVKYSLNNIYIEARDSIKDLGIIITSELSWTGHCNMITSRAYKQLGLIRRIFTTNCVSAKNSSTFL